MNYWLYRYLFIIFIIVHLTLSHFVTFIFSTDPGVKPWLWNVEEYPNPQTRPRNCNRFQRSYVCDPDDILSVEHANNLDAFIEQRRNKTPCVCTKCEGSNKGIIIGIALLKNMYLPHNEPLITTTENFAEAIRQSWKLGNCDNDILILLATLDRHSFAAVGAPVIKHVSRETSRRIFLESRVYFDDRKYYEGLQGMIQSYSEILEKVEEKVDRVEESKLGFIIGITVAVVLLIAFIIGGLIFWWKSRRNDDSEYYWEKSDSIKRADLSEREKSRIPVNMDETDVEIQKTQLEYLSEEEEEDTETEIENPKVMKTFYEPVKTTDDTEENETKSLESLPEAEDLETDPIFRDKEDTEIVVSSRDDKRSLTDDNELEITSL